MSSRRRSSKGGEIRVELKYCERCGGLWIRETGTAAVYCDACRKKVAELPIPRKKSSARISLPMGTRTLMDELEVELGEDLDGLESMGGVA